MAEQIKDKVPLNRVTHSVRAAQAKYLMTVLQKHWESTTLQCRRTSLMSDSRNGISVPNVGILNRFHNGFLIIEKKHAGNC